MTQTSETRELEKPHLIPHLTHLFEKVALNNDSKSLHTILRFMSQIQGWSSRTGLSDVPEAKYLRDQVYGMPFSEAELCALDEERTMRFIKGIWQVVNQKKEERPTEKIRIVEAGSGTGILTVAAACFGGDRVEVLGIEINDEAAEKSNNFLQACGFPESKVRVVYGDATTYVVDEPIDILISENLHTGEVEEPMTRIVTHLSKYMRNDGVVIPSEVRLSLALGKTDWRTSGLDRRHIELARIQNPTQVISKLGQYAIIQYGPWGVRNQLDSSSSNPGAINATVPIGHLNGYGNEVNVGLISMDVVITDNVVLPKDAAKFLGTTHVWSFEPRIVQEGQAVNLLYSLGADANTVQFIFK